MVGADRGDFMFGASSIARLDTVRLLRAFVNLSGLKIINSGAIDLSNINQWWIAALIEGRKTMTVCGTKAR